MSKTTLEHLKETMTKAGKALRSGKNWWFAAGSKRRQMTGAVAACICMCGFYAVSKGKESSQTKVLTSRDAEFKKARILGDPYATSGRAKEQLLTKSAREYSDSQKILMEGLTQINSRMDLIEKRVTVGAQLNGNFANPTPTAQLTPSPAPSSEQNVTPVMAPSLTPVESGREPIDMRPNMPGRPAYPYASVTRQDPAFQAPKGPPVISFPVQGIPTRERAEVVLPVGSYVKAKLLTGVEAPEGNPYPVLLQLDFANILPNKKSLDLRGCFMIAKAQGDLSTERVQMQATKLSCVSKSGQMFERDINGFVADASDNSFAVIGTVNTKQDRVAAMAFLSSVVEGVGRAIQMAQTSEQTSAVGTSKTLLTGNQGKYIAGGGAGAAAGMVAQWYLKQAQSLLPTINVGSGQDIWVVMNETTSLPHEYFKKVSMGESHGNDYSLVNRLFD